MLADVVVPRSATRVFAADQFYTYRVPPHLTAEIAAGQLVTVPFGERTAAGVVWALNAADELVDDTSEGDSHPIALREVASILLHEPLLTEAQRALAEWLAGEYAAPLSAAARLFLPPSLLRAVREVLRPLPSPDIPQDIPLDLTADAAQLLAMLRERGWLERAQVRAVLGTSRARKAIRELRDAGQIAARAELPEGFLAARRERVVRMAGSVERIAAWRAKAREALDALAHAGQERNPRRPPTRGARSTREPHAERLLRQLAVVDVLERPVQTTPFGLPEAWRLEELRRLTRATQVALRELESAGLIEIAEVEVRRDPLAGRQIERTGPLPLTPAQAEAHATITGAEPGSVFLLHGITGSGKTEVYLQALASALERGQRGLVLVPEIALTPQAMARFAGRFPGRVALLHSGLTDAERLDEWRRIRGGAVDVVLGSRSALFAPLDRLGLIVVDEEHEAAYKESRQPAYHARDAAVRLGALAGAVVVLGSATPSVESWWQTRSGAYQLIELRERAPAGVADNTATPGLPPVTVVDLRAELRAGNTSILSQPLQEALRATLDRGEQAVLFLNRRGTASSVVCRECGYAVRCPSCDVSMTFHASERRMLCHYCGRAEPPPQTCPVCRSASIRYFGLGTERVEVAVKRQFPRARVLRWDRDTARTRTVHEELLRAFANREADVLVGTQMIAKGLDLPGVTLVGVVSADIALFLPDFRASERAFQLLTQVAGRAGRGERPGRVLVQTFNPQHFCIQAAAEHDYAAFVAAELAARARYSYPPYRRFVKATFEHHDRYSAQIEATAFAARIERLIRAAHLRDTDVVGPAPAFLERLRGAYRWQLILRSPDPVPLLRALAGEELPRGWSLDVDPISTL